MSRKPKAQSRTLRQRNEAPIDDRTPEGVLKIHVGSPAWLTLAGMHLGEEEAQRIHNEFRNAHPDLQDASEIKR